MRLRYHFDGQCYHLDETPMPDADQREAVSLGAHTASTLERHLQGMGVFMPIVFTLESPLRVSSQGDYIASPLGEWRFSDVVVLLNDDHTKVAYIEADVW